MKEQWKEIKPIHGQYEISNLGRIRNSAGKFISPTTGGTHGKFFYYKLRVQGSYGSKSYTINNLVDKFWPDNEITVNEEWVNGIRAMNGVKPLTVPKVTRGGLKILECAYCGATFRQKHNRQHYCCPEHQEIGARIAAKKRMEKAIKDDNPVFVHMPESETYNPNIYPVL